MSTATATKPSPDRILAQLLAWCRDGNVRDQSGNTFFGAMLAEDFDAVQDKLAQLKNIQPKTLEEAETHQLALRSALAALDTAFASPNVAVAAPKVRMVGKREVATINAYVDATDRKSAQEYCKKQGITVTAFMAEAAKVFFRAVKNSPNFYTKAAELDAAYRKTANRHYQVMATTCNKNVVEKVQEFAAERQTPVSTVMRIAVTHYLTLAVEGKLKTKGSSC